MASDGDVKPWLYRVVVNTCNSKLRKELPHRNRRAADEVLDSLPDADDLAEHLSEASDLMSALQSLPTHLRIVIVLRYFADLSEQGAGYRHREEAGDSQVRVCTRPGACWPGTPPCSRKVQPSPRR